MELKSLTTLSLLERFRSKLLIPMSSRWREVTFLPPTKSMSDRNYKFHARGVTLDDPPRYFLTWVEIDSRIAQRRSGEIEAYLEGLATQLAAKLDSFLDPECECVPSEEGLVGEPCDFHKGIRKTETRFPEGAEL